LNDYAHSLLISITNLQNSAKDYLLENLEELVPILSARGCYSQLEYEALMSTMSLASKVENLKDNMQKYGSYTIEQEEDTYGIIGPDMDTAVKVEDAPAWVKRRVGLLKLLPVGDYAEEAGYRVGEKAFVIYGDAA